MKTNQQNWPNPYWDVTEEWYLVKQDSLILLFYTSPTHGENLKKNMKVAVEFIENNIDLKSATWLKEQEWFWCDKEDWKTWKKGQKKIRKEKRLLKRNK